MVIGVVIGYSLWKDQMGYMIKEEFVISYQFIL